MRLGDKFLYTTRFTPAIAPIYEHQVNLLQKFARRKPLVAQSWIQLNFILGKQLSA